ncbi:MAG: hypothetical protein PUD22_03295 [Erysipelotrichaceae bacterium]|nr:hypothetical protein [Erysipelotrichaceae bacterium]
MDNHHNKLAVWILAACVFALIGCIIIAFIGHFITNPDHEVHVHYVIQTDTTGHVTSDAKVQMDSLIWAFQTHEARISSKYEYMVDQKSNMESYLYLCGLVLSIILAVLGFFGFKSLHDIENRLKNQIEPTVSTEAKSHAEGICRDLFKNYKEQTDENLAAHQNSVKSELFINFNEKTDEIKKESRENVQKAVSSFQKDANRVIDEAINQRYSNSLGEKLQDVKDNTSTIADLQKDVANLRKDIDFMRSLLSKPLSVRAKILKIETPEAPSSESRRDEATVTNPFSIGQK